MNLSREVIEIYKKISKLESLKPSRSVNALLNRLVGLCTLPCSVEMDVRVLGKDVEEKRRHLIELCGETKGHLEHHYAGPLLLTSIVLATHHLKSAAFDNYGIDAGANAVASELLCSYNEYDPSLSQRMSFITFDILCMGGDWLVRYDVVFVAVLVGLRREEKMKVVKHIEKHIKSRALVII